MPCYACLGLWMFMILWYSMCVSQVHGNGKMLMGCMTLDQKEETKRYKEDKNNNIKLATRDVWHRCAWHLEFSAIPPAKTSHAETPNNTKIVKNHVPQSSLNSFGTCKTSDDFRIFHRFQRSRFNKGKTDARITTLPLRAKTPTNRQTTLSCSMEPHQSRHVTTLYPFGSFRMLQI